MVTLFTIPKPFEGHAAVIQRNALASWARLRPRCEVLVFGDEAGTADAVQECGLQHIPQVARNEQGTPLINDAFAQAAERARHEILVYANADIILLDDLVQAVERVRNLPRFLLCGRRWNLELREPLRFDGDWVGRLRLAVAREGVLAIPGAIDYFAFPRRMFGFIPAFAVGRVEWDQWMLFRARALGAALVDATSSVLAIHQNHDYRHLARAPRAAVQREVDRNRELALFHRLDLRDATHVLTPTRLQPARDLVHLRRRLFSLPKFYLPASPGLRALYGFWRRRVRGLPGSHAADP